MNRMERAEHQLTRAIERHGDRYDYDDWVSTYVSVWMPVAVGCRLHGTYYPTARNHVAGSHCPQCANDKRREIKILPFAEVVRRAIEVHGTRYNYDQSSYTASCEKMRIECQAHGWFNQLAINHTLGNGCPICAGRKVKS